MLEAFFPMSAQDMQDRGWDSVDFALVTGDAFVDHPSFGIAIIARLLESRGFRVGIISQPNWRDTTDFQKFGRPNYAFLITAGNIDSMVNNYTVAKKRRHDDVYSAGGKGGNRPDRAAIVYSNKVRETYKDIPIILGGLEASLRRLGHYDYWDNKVRRSILLDSKADMVIYGMGERQILELSGFLEKGIPIEKLKYIRGTVVKTAPGQEVKDAVILPSFDEITDSKKAFAKSYMVQYKNTDNITGKTLAEAYGNVYVIQNPPADPLSTKELDQVFELPYTRSYHPMYEKDGGVPSLTEVKFSLMSNRGCFGGCSFCALTFHQGRVVQMRSADSLVREAEALTKLPDFKGYIHDVGGPTANFRERACDKQVENGVCSNKQCLFPKACNNLKVTHKDYLQLLRRIRALPGVKKVFVRSGIRYDYLIYDQDSEFFMELCRHHISGQLKVAPEHVSQRVLDVMGKPGRDVYDRFVQKYTSTNKKIGKEQHLVPYFMSSHPGSDIHAAIELAEYIRDTRQIPEQAQDFYPTPGTLSTCMYYTELDPRTLKPVYVAKDPREKALQRALIQYNKPQNRKLVVEALKKANREDLVGFGKKCLIRPRSQKKRPYAKRK